MNPSTWKHSPLVLALVVALSACARDNTRSDVADKRDDSFESRPAPAAAPAPRAAPAPKRAPAAPAASTAATPAPAPLADDELVGVEACDDYLENYRSCHRVLGMYPADSLESRYQTLRARLAEQAVDPAAHESLRLQCESLAKDMSTALDGRDCPDEDTIADDTNLEEAIGDDEPDTP